jgi:hypothetical protein
MFADGRLPRLSHKAGAEIEQLQSCFEANASMQTTCDGMECDPVLWVMSLLQTHSDLDERYKGLFLRGCSPACVWMRKLFSNSQSHLPAGLRIDFVALEMEARSRVML